jgi:signal transduction histidine kinase
MWNRVLNKFLKIKTKRVRRRRSKGRAYVKMQVETTGKHVLLVAAVAVSIAGLYLLSRLNYLLFHSSVEVFSIVITFAIFAIAWNARRMMDCGYLLFIGIACLFVGGVDLLHTLAYNGMGVFPEYGANLATQLWIATRYMLSFSFLAAVFFVNRKFRPSLVIAGYAVVTALLFGSIFYWGNFPIAFTDGVGLTPFKVASEYVISLILLLSIGLLIRKRVEFSGNVVKLMAAAMAVAIAAEMAFTLYTDVYGVANMIGHLLTVVSFYLIYKALIETGLTKPYDLLFRNLKKNETALTNYAAELTVVNNRLEQEVSERKKAEEALRQHDENLEDLVEEKTKLLKDSERMAAIGQTAGMVGHDIRNPLQSIIGEVYLANSELSTLPDSKEKTNIQESLDMIKQNTEYINKIVLDLQDFAKPLSPCDEETNIEQMIEELLTNNGIPENIQTEANIEKDARTVRADSAYMKRILGNLVSNAVQAMPDGGKLTVQARREKSDVVITVKDTGVGISEDAKDRLFTPLFTTKSKGQGFGLAVVKRLTEALDGTVTFESQENKGTTFTIRLPQPKKTRIALS